MLQLVLWLLGLGSSHALLPRSVVLEAEPTITKPPFLRFSAPRVLETGTLVEESESPVGQPGLQEAEVVYCVVIKLQK